MAGEDKRLERMRANPLDWRIEDVAAVCRSNGVSFTPPNKGSHAKVSDSLMIEILTIPYKRPIKPKYIKKLVNYIDVVKLKRSMSPTGR
jgi:hypothetical protein